MKLLHKIFLFSLTVCSACKAEAAPQMLPQVSFAEFPLPIKRSYFSATSAIIDRDGDRSPMSKSNPANIKVALEDYRGYKTHGYWFPSRNIIRIYPLATINKSDFPWLVENMEMLNKLLIEKPKKTIQNDSKFLPDYPFRNAAHAFELNIQYIETESFTGIIYLTLFTQDGSNHANNDELIYLFQGITRDHQYYISADLRVSHPKLNSWKWPDTSHSYDADIQLLSGLSEKSYVPSMAALRKWIATIEIN
jgi:hypothetical protein